MITRRQLILALPASALLPPRSYSQQRSEKIPYIGFVGGGGAEILADRLEPLRDGLRELGYEDGKNIKIEYRLGEGDYDRLKELISEFIRSGVDVLVTAGTPATSVARKITSTIPIVMMGVGDPVGSGLIASLSQPGGNVTGITNLSVEIGAKRFDLLASTVPKLARVAVLLNAANPTRHSNFNQIVVAAQSKNVHVVRIEARTAADLEAAFGEMKRQRLHGFVVQTDQYFLQQRSKITGLAAQARLPAIYGQAEFVKAGGLMSYGNKPNWRRAAFFVEKILKGAKPRDLPVEQPTEFELAFNKKTAAALGLKISDSILLQATHVIG